MIIKEPGARALLRKLFDAAIAAADPAICVPSRLPVPSDRGRVVIVGAGKASAAMARAVEDAARQAEAQGRAQEAAQQPPRGQ